jgi:spoIIIJ-associated protein
MSPLERRIIHTALQDDEAIETFSEGDEPFRRVVVAFKG